MLDFAWRVVLVLLLLAAAYLLWRGIYVLLQAFAGILFAVFLWDLSDWLSRRTGVRHGWALASVLLALALALGGLGRLFANRLAIQVEQLSQELPQALQQVEDYLHARPWGHFLLKSAPQLTQSFAQAGGFSRGLTGLVSGVASVLEAALVILIVGIFGAAEPNVYRNGLLYLIPPGRRPRVAQALDAVVTDLRRWLLGELCLMVMIGLTTALGLWLLGIPLALTLGVIAGILELVPYIGAWLSAVPAGLIALLVSPWHMVMTLALFLGLHVLEAYFLAPLVQRRAIYLAPALTLVAQILLGHLGGVLGLFVAAPLTVVAVVFVKMLYVEDTLGEECVEIPSEATPSASSK
jgi:predicted PurR-regulated permease PerM